MSAEPRRLLSSPVAVFVAFAFYVFAAWQVFNHVYLMRLPMMEHHMVSLVVETLGAAIVAFFVIRELERKRAEVERLSRQKDMLASALVHDLRQPLTAVLAGIGMVEQESRLPKETRELLAIARQGGSQLLSMVNDLLDIARFEAGRAVLQQTRMRPDEFISEGARFLAPIAVESGIDLAVEVPDHLPEVSGDGERLRRVVMNLVGNALKYTPSGGRVGVSAEESSDGRELHVVVSDTGEGIPKDQQERIFDQFAVVEGRESRRRTSTGLGLTFCRMVVEAHGGRIWVESEPGEGATFRFALPLQPEG
jgi:signal transduction histidine kinase